MMEPSALAYARHFDLTRDHYAEDLWQHLKILSSPAPSRSQHEEVYRNISQKLLSISENHALTATGDDEQRPIDMSDYLERVINHEKPDFEEVYQTLLPDHRRSHRYKVQIPLLTIGGGDVRKDARKIRRGIDLDQALDDVLEDHDHIVRSSNQMKRHSDVVTADQVQEVVRFQLQRAAQPDVLTTSSRVVRHILEASMGIADEKQRFSVIQALLPCSHMALRSSASCLAEADFDIDSGEQQDCRLLAQSCQVNCAQSTALTESLDQECLLDDKDLLSFLAAAVDEEVMLTQEVIIPTAGDNRPSENERSPHESSREIAHESPDTRSCKRRKLTHHTASPLNSVLQHDSCALTCEAIPQMNEFKVPIIFLEPVATELPKVNTDALAVAYSRPGTLSTGCEAETTDLVARLPTVPIADVFEPELPKEAAVMDKFLGMQKNSLTSDQILWKEPGIRLLDHLEEGHEDLVESDFTVEDKIIEHQGPLKQEIHLPETISSHFRPISRYFNSSQDPDHANTLQTECDYFKDISRRRTSPQFAMKTLSKSIMDCKNSANSRKTRLSALPRKQCIINPLRQISRPDHDTLLSGPGSDSLSSFMELRGRQFRPPPQNPLVGKMEIYSDPIQCPQFCPAEQHVKPKFYDKHAQIQGLPKDVILHQHMPEMEPCEKLTIIFLNDSLLQQKPLLIRFLEDRVSDTFSLIYRNLNTGPEHGPDVIINATTCLFIVSLQILNQRPLPGTHSKTNLSPAHDNICLALERYDCIFVLVHFVLTEDRDIDSRTQTSQSEFASFCANLTSRDKAGETSVSPIWLPCVKASTTSEVVNAWIWRMIRQHGYSPQSQPECPTQGALIDDVTIWETLLVRTRLNPMAAQVVIGLLKQSTDMVGSTGAGNWGLRRLMQMSEGERHHMFDSLIGERAVSRLCGSVSK